jgi:fucose permease
MTTTANRASEVPAPQRDGLAFTAFLLALFVMVFPLQADLLNAALGERQFFIAGLILVACFAAVFTPLKRRATHRTRDSQVDIRK